MKVSEFMSKNVVSCFEDQTVEEAAKIMSEKEFSALPIKSREGKLVGIITESDFVGKSANIPRALASIKSLFGHNLYFGEVEPIYKEAKQKKLSEVMSTKLVTLNNDSSLTEVVKLMNDKEVKRVPIVNGDELVGIVTRKDLLKAFIATN